MPDYAGPIALPTITGTLVLILALPALSLVYAIVRACMRARGNRRGLAIVGIALSFVASLYQVVLLARLPVGERVLLQHVWRLVRVGQLDVSFDLRLDPLSAVFCLLVTGASTLMIGRARKSIWLEVLVVAMLVVVLADNLVLMFVGWEALGLAVWGLVGPANLSRAGVSVFVARRVGDVAFFAGTALLYWGLGGSFSNGGYAPDLAPRIIAVHAPGDAPPRTSPEAGGRVSLLSYSGATVYMDDARTPLAGADDAPLRAPFVRAPLRAGAHSFRIHAGGGLDDYVVRDVAFGGDRDVSLTLLGPTLTFAQIDAQLETRDAFGDRSRRAAIRARTLGGAGLLSVACVLFLIAAMSMSASPPLHSWLPQASSSTPPEWSTGILAVTTLPAGAYLLLRLAPLFALSTGAEELVAFAGVATMILAALAGARQRTPGQSLALLAVAQAGGAFLAIGVGAYAAAVLHVLVGSCVIACMLPSRSSERAYFVACAALAGGPVPLLTGAWATWGSLSAALALRRSSATSPWLVFGGLAGCLALSFCAWRTYYRCYFGGANPVAALGGENREQANDLTRRAHFPVLLAPAVFAGVVLGFGPHMVFAQPGDSALERWLSFLTPHSTLSTEAPNLVSQWALLLLVTGVGCAGWAIARRRRAADDEATFLAAPLSRVFYLPEIQDALVTRPVLRLSQLAANMDRWVLDGAFGAVFLGARTVAWAQGWLDDRAVSALPNALTEKALRVRDKVVFFSENAARAVFFGALAIGVLAAIVVPMLSLRG